MTLPIVAEPIRVYANDYTSFHVAGPTIRSLYGDVLSRSGGSQQVMIEYTLKNIELQPFDKPVIAITEIRDEDGITLYLAWQTIDLAPDKTSTIGTSWLLPYDAQVDDVYQIRFFMVTALAPESEVRSLTALMTQDIRVGSTMPFTIVPILRP